MPPEPIANGAEDHRRVRRRDADLTDPRVDPPPASPSELRYQADGSFGAPVLATPMGHGHGLAIGDVNGDGSPDIYVGRRMHEPRQPARPPLLNRGNGRTGRSSRCPPLPPGPLAGCGDTAAIIDFDHDGAQGHRRVERRGKRSAAGPERSRSAADLGGLAAATVRKTPMASASPTPTSVYRTITTARAASTATGPSTSGGSGCWVKSNALSIGFASAFAHVGRGVGPPVGRRGRGAARRGTGPRSNRRYASKLQDRVVDVALLRVRADHHRGARGCRSRCRRPVGGVTWS